MKRLRFFSLLMLIICFSFTACSQQYSLELEIPEAPKEKMAAGTASTLLGAQKTRLQFWHFTDKQQGAILAFFEQGGSAALELTFSLHLFKEKVAGKNGEAMPASASSIGFLYEEDFSAKARLQRQRKSRPQVSGNFTAFGADKSVTILLSMNRDSLLAGLAPAGFSVASNERYRLVSARIVPACVGFDVSRQPALYAFAPNGGLLQPFSKSFDMTGLPLAFPAANTAAALMPTLLVTTDGPKDVYVAIGGERITLRPGNAASGAILPCAALKAPFSQFSVMENSEGVVAALVKASDSGLLAVSAKYARAVLKPILVDPGLIMEWRSASWRGRDYELFAWDRFPSVLIFDTASYKVQDDFFRRLAFFAEKAGYRGRLLDDSFLENQHGYNAHDYRAETLAAFFELARKSNFPLNERELLLKEILSVNGIISFAPDGEVLPGKGAVISISQDSAMYLRWTFIAHEGWHGIFFTDSDFQNAVASLYYTMDQKALHALLTYFSVTPTLNYDRSDDYLMKNEFMAYMLQRPLAQVREYYMNLASRSHAQMRMKEEADYIIATHADGYVSAATMLDQYVGDRWNLAAGRVWLVNR